MRIIWLESASLDLLEIAEYIASDNPHAARSVARVIRERTAKLARNPRIGRPGRVEGARELVIARYPCIVAYQVDLDAVRILAVVHTARRWPESFPAAE